MLWDKTYPDLEQAVRALVANDAPLDERLELAIGRVSGLSGKHFPPTLQSEYRQLMQNIAAYRDGGSRPERRTDLALAIFTLFKKFMVEAWPPNSPLDKL
jgi:hypothetical protein